MVFGTLIIGAIIIACLYKLNKDYVVLTLFTKRVRTVDGTPLENSVALPKGLTIFGNAFDFALASEGMFDFLRKLAAEMKRSYLQYGLFRSFYNIITAEDAELVMNDQKNLIHKGVIYNFFVPFLNRGLLTSSGKKWYSRRKMLTPAFHFKILTQFEEIFKEESKKFVESLEASDLSSVTLNEIIPKFTLNAICETALGVKLDEQMNADQYRGSFKMIEEVFLMRCHNPFYIIDSLYKVFLAPKIKKHISIVHYFSSEIINKRRQAFAEELEQSEDKEDNQGFYTKKRYAMLDTLLRAERDGLIDHVGICEEVDTFMFEGYDTTSMALLFSLMNLSLYPEMQERCYQEILDCVEDDLSQLNIQQLSKLQYLECFIKETLRLYPSVPVIAREAANETRLANNLILPKGAQVTIHIIDIHRSAKYYENPNKFDPERFTAEASAGRHPYAYVPFSAGQRNCIGQKFAMLELKTILVNIIKTFKILPLMKDQDIKLEFGMIIRTPNIIKVKLEKRSLKL
ncbi:cytochrome P450 4p1-like [Bactrocera oleae]|uniref:cytochrome P450 4p1-like n=1 Tax=Bactrocera oleae TaxID=104688 RepID=UPI00387E800C